jgi:hypothetical protein
MIEIYDYNKERSGFQHNSVVQLQKRERRIDLICEKFYIKTQVGFASGSA